MEDTINNYVVGFIFDKKGEKLILINKKRPDWQKGKLNGVGGHIKVGESITDAMIRETKEETGIETEYSDWSFMGTGININDSAVTVNFLKCFLDKTKFHTAKDMTDEELVIVPCHLFNDIKNQVVYNLTWLIPLALDKQTLFSSHVFTLNK